VGRPGLEPGTYGLKVRYSAIELTPLGCRATAEVTASRVPSPQPSLLKSEAKPARRSRPSQFRSSRRTCDPVAGALLSGSIRQVTSAYYEPAGQDGAGQEAYVATEATSGPWSPDAQHGGPPSALAARALELHQADERQRLARVSIDILRPVPVGKVSIRTRMVRPGRRVSLLESVMESDGQEVLLARGWRIERRAGDVPEVTDGVAVRLVPPKGRDMPPIFSSSKRGYLATIEWRFLSDDEPWPTQAAEPAPHDSLGAPGTGKPDLVGPLRAAWTRPTLPLLPGEQGSAMSRVLLVADSGSGVGAALPPTEFIFINVDLTVVLYRDPESEWLLLEPVTTIGSDGTGMTTTRLSDPRGTCGTGAQTLLVAPR
jgi:Thioesterase-like superfamily